LQQKFPEVGRSILKPQTPAPPEKFHALAKKILAQDIKMLTGEGTKAEKGKNRSGKGDCESKRKGKQIRNE